MLKFLLIGFMVAIGWRLGQLIFDEIENSIMSRLVEVRWYRKITNRPDKKDKRKREIRIGF